MWKKFVTSIIPLCLYGLAAAQTTVVPIGQLAGQHNSESEAFTLTISSPALNGLTDIQSIQLRVQGHFTMGQALYLGLVYDPDYGDMLAEIPGPLGIGFTAHSSNLSRAVGFFFSDGDFNLTETFNPDAVQGLTLGETFSLYVHFSPEYLYPGSYLTTLSEPQLNITSAELVIVTVPEPGTLGLLTVGTVMLARKRRHNKCFRKSLCR